MKQLLLFSILFLAISSMSKAQLTVMGVPNDPGYSSYDTPTGQFYTVSSGTSMGGPISSILPFVKDPGSNLYIIDVSSGGIFVKNLIIRMGNYWYIGNRNFIFPTSSYQLRWRYPVQTNSIDPPCSGLWESGGYAVNPSTPSNVAGIGIFQTITIAGATCSTNNPVSPSPFNIFSNSISIPSLNYGQIINIPTPITGTMVYNTTSNCVSIYNGTSWSCLVAASSATYNATTLTTLPFTLTNQHNYVIYTGAAGTLTIPVASTCVGRLYNISNYGMGIITLSQPYTNSNSGTSTTVNINTNVQIIANSSGWVKVN